MDVESLVNRSVDAHEIDVLEQYGDAIGILRTTLHYWSNNGSTSWGEVRPQHTCSEAPHRTAQHNTALTP